MITLLKLALSEITRNKKFTSIFLLQLCLGLTGFIFLNIFKSSFDGSLNKQSKDILTADLSISARRMLSEKETLTAAKALPEGTSSHMHIGMYSMVATESHSRLVHIQGIEAGWPFYGKLVLKKAGTSTPAITRELQAKPLVWVYPEVLVQLGIQTGDQIKIGEQSFTVADVVEDDPGTIQAAFSFAPKVYTGLNWLYTAGLIKKGSTFWNTRFYRLPGGENHRVQEISESLSSALTDPGIRVTSHQLKGERTGRMLRYLFDYLGLVALAGFFLAGLGLAYFFYSHFTRRLKEIAVMLSLGLSPVKLLTTYLLQIGLLGILAATASLMFTWATLPLVPDFFAAVYKVDISPALSPEVILFTFAQSLAGSLLVCFPFLRKLLSFRPAGLFQEHGHFSLSMRIVDSLWFAPALTFYWYLACAVSHSWLTGSLFTLAFVGSAIIFSTVYGYSARKLSLRITVTNFTVRSGFQYLFRKPSQSVIAFLSIGLGSLLISTILQLRSGLSEETGAEGNETRPDYFLFDIQEEQKDGLRDFLQDRKEALTYLSPMISARLLALNGKEVTRVSLGQKARTREQEQSRRMRNRSYNLSYRTELFDSESVVAGKLFTGPWKEGSEGNPLPEISLEHRFSSRIGAVLGDKLTFDVQGVEFTGIITSLRKVRWTSFQPNFFIQFQPGVLEEAPKTWLAGISARPGKKLSLQQDLVKEFPNVSVVDVEKVIEKILNISSYMQRVLILMSLLTLFTGFVILCFICQYQTSLRIWDMRLLHVLGSQARQIRRSVVFEFGFLSFLAAMCGTLMATLLSQLLGRFIFQSSWSIWWESSMLLTIFVALTGALISWTVALYSVRKNLSLKN